MQGNMYDSFHPGMLVNVAGGECADMDMERHSFLFQSRFRYFSLRNRVQILSTDWARAALRFSADFTFMKTGSEEEVGEELFFLTLGS